jgi:hypothetical protein
MFGRDWGDCVVDGVARLTCLPVVLQNVVTFALIASGIVAVFFIIYAGIRYVTSGGDQKRIDAARKTLTWAIIGLIIILAAFFIVALISTLTGVDCIKTFGFNNCN